MAVLLPVVDGGFAAMGGALWLGLCRWCNTAVLLPVVLAACDAAAGVQ